MNDLHRATVKVERAFLGAVMTARVLPTVKVTPAEFVKDEHAVLWQHILAVDSLREEPDLTRMIHELSKTNAVDRAGGMVYVAGHMDSTDCSDIAVYARVIKESARSRRLAKLRVQ